MKESEILSLYDKLSYVSDPVEEAKINFDIVLLETGSQEKALAKEIEVLQQRWLSALSDVTRLKINRRIDELLSE